MSKSQKAMEQVKKASRWLIISGAALTALNSINALLQELQSGGADVKSFVVGFGFTLAFMVVNALVYYIHEYQKA